MLIFASYRCFGSPVINKGTPSSPGTETPRHLDARKELLDEIGVTVLKAKMTLNDVSSAARHA
jgi:hypothetical protein